jgi:hypothetical protein
MAKLEMVPVMMSSLLSGTVDQHAEDDYRDCPVCDSPFENRPKTREQPRCIFPDNVHVTTSGKKLFAYELVCALDTSMVRWPHARPYPWGRNSDPGINRRDHPTKDAKVGRLRNIHPLAWRRRIAPDNGN